MNESGILSLLKPAGMTSHDCVAKLRKLYQTKKVGHTGTLDPEVTGVLPICIGRATKVAEYMSEYPKEYEAEVTIGFSTTTEDQTGEVVEKKNVENSFSEEELDTVLHSFLGEQIQIPPMFSAVKVKGRRLYDYARKGEQVERPKRTIVIHEIKRIDDIIFDQEKQNLRFRFKVRCSKGTYVRTLAVDMGQKLGYPAHMSKLIRTASGPFSLEDCLSFEEIEQEELVGRYARLKPLETALSFLASYTVEEELEKKIKNGSVLPKIKMIEENRFTLYNKEGHCLAIYQNHPTEVGYMKPEKMIWTQ
ncbi:tRNA pseudouridine 5S synthase [Bacillus sp. TS-2]|nr:tRNA pseudouridine 5S synthase [Bacillus sp. TS-2]